ncbi:type II secretion system minor pseudopilin GspH [Shewanella maritima]|uniref:type II secretion system minor pseudopilin GspH n=1 Tax=Shewanella maritima TaxID=2520507 RepID=UPI003736526F
MRSSRQSGFTLLEVLLVALLMGIAATMITLTSSTAGPKQALEKHARQFMAATELVIDEAVLSGAFIGIVIEDSQYQFVMYEEQKWQPIIQDRLLTTKTIDDGMQMNLVLDGMPLEQEDEQSESWFDDPFIDDKDKEERKKYPEPQIMLFPSGEMTPFELTFVFDLPGTQQETVRVVGDALGRMALGQFDEDY